MQLTIIGAGLGRIEFLSQAALKKIKEADWVIATDRLYERFKQLNQNSISLPISEVAEQLMVKSSQGLKSVVLLASGDVGFYSISKSLKNILAGNIGYEIEFVNGTNSLQYLTSKLQISYEDIKTLSVHGREQSAVPFVCYNRCVFILTGGKYKAHDVIEQLVLAGLGEVTVTVGENLSDANERIITQKAINLQSMRFDNLCVLLVENPNCVNPYKTLCDSDFIRAKVPMTKEDIRTLCLAKLDIQPSDVVYDIGAGTGSVSIAMAYCAKESFVYAIEKQENATLLIRQNTERLSAWNLNVINKEAPDGLSDLPSPNKVFIGGSSGNLKEIFDVLLQKNAYVRIVVSAITIQTLNEAISCFSQNGIDPNVVCANISISQKLGRYDMMKAQNPVYIISGERHG